MDKYHIYEEVGAGKHSQVFKGREKMDIEYVAIKRVEKSMMDQVVKEVQVIHRLRSPNVLKFYDWYETRNNVWLILEFCTGGDLLTLIKQDHREPESAVRLFGVDLLAGLQQTHACGYLHGDLRPSNVLIDEYGILKLSGFGLARGIPEDGEGDRRRGGEGGLYSQQQQQQRQRHDPSGCREGSGDDRVGLRFGGRDPTYMAPELFSDGEDAVSFASDFWSLGCVLFELLTGEPPFRESSAIPVSERIGRENPPGLDRGEWQGACMSPDFCGLVGWLLQKDPLHRPTWPQLLAHPFWDNYQTPSPLEMPAQPLFDRALAAAAAVKEEKAASVAAREAQAARQSEEDLGSLDYSSARGGKGLAAAGGVGGAAAGTRRWRDGGGSDSLSPRAALAAGTEELHQGEEKEEEEEDEEGDGEEGYRIGHPRNGHRRQGAGGRGEETRVTHDRLRGTAAGMGQAYQAVGESGGGAKGGEREKERPTAPPPRRGPPTTRAVDFRNGQRQERKNEHLEYLDEEETATSGDSSGRTHLPVTERGKDPAPTPAPAQLMPPAVERRKAPHHGSCVNVGDDNSFGGAVRGVGGRGGDNAKKSDAAAAAAALNGLRLRGRIPPVRGGRTSPPSEVSAATSASLSSSLEERYGSSFEEDTEGSSSCSAVGGSGSSEAATTGGGGAAATATAGQRKSACSGRTVMTPGSVGTATTATPSTGCASVSSTRGGRGSSCGSSGVDRNGIGTTVTGNHSGRAGARLTPPATAATPGDGGEHWRRQTSSGSPAASTSGSSSESRMGCPVPGSESLGSGSGDVAMTSRFLTTTLQVGRPAAAAVAAAEESPCSERVSPSSWTQSSDSSTSPVSREAIAGEWSSGGGASPPRTWGAGQGQEGRQTEVDGQPSAWVARADAIAADRKGDGGREGATKTRVLETRGVHAHSGNGGTGGAQGGHPPTLGKVEGRERGNDNCSVCFMGGGKPTEAVVVGADGEGIAGSARRQGVRDLLLHTSDAQVTPIVGNNRSVDFANPAHARGGQPSSRDQLPFEALLPETVFVMLPPDLEAHLTGAYNALTEVSASVRQRGQTLLYLQSLAPVPRVANLLINSTFLVLLLRLLRKPRPAAIRDTVATLIGLLVRHATYIAPGAGKTSSPSQSVIDGGMADEDGVKRGRVEGANGAGPSAGGGGGGGLLSALIAVIRERPAPGRAAQAAALRRNTMAALGELLFYIVTQEPEHGAGAGDGGGGGGADVGGSKAWDIPVAAVGAAISKCLEDVEYEGVQQHAAKTLENVLAQAGPSHALVRALVTPHLALCLLDLMRHASSEGLRGTAVAGLSHLLEHDILGGECGATGSIGRVDDVGSAEFRRRGRGDSEIAAGVRHEDGHGSGRHYMVEETRVMSGWAASRVMCEPGAALVVVNGLSEGSSPASRRAFLNVFNLVLWGSRNGAGGSGGGGGVDGASSRGKQVGPPRTSVDDQADQHHHHRGVLTGAGGRPHHHHHHIALRRAAEAMLDSQHLLPRLLRAAEHGEGTILRAKGFLALRLSLEVAPPVLLLKACRSRLLPLLARAIGALAPRATAAAATPGLSPQQEYLYECCTTLADWLCTVPERAARRLATELRRQGAGGSAARGGGGGGGGGGHNQRVNNSSSSSGSRRVIRQPLGVDAARTSLEAAMAAFPAVVHLINSPLLRGRAVTGAFVSGVSVCLGLCCPVFTERGDVSAGEAAVSSAAGFVDVVDKDGGTGGGALSALLPTVETLAQQAEAALLPHSEAVSEALIPVLCRLLRSPSGDTRALAVAIFRVLLPPLLRPAVPSQQPNFLDRIAATPSYTTVGAAVAVGCPARVRSAIAVHLLPLAAALLRDHTPIPQYTVRLLADVAREWVGLGGALLAQQDAIPALLDRLPCPLLSSSPTPPPAPPGSSSTMLPWPATNSSPRSTRVLGAQHPESEPGSTAPALDPALAALLALLVERDDGGGGAGASAGGGLGGDRYIGGGGDDRRGDKHADEELCVALLRLKLPGRVAAAVVGAVAAGIPETAEAFLGLAVALLSATVGYHGRRAGESTPAGGGTDRRGFQPSRKGLLEPLLLAVPAAAEGLQLFCSRGGWIDRGAQQLAGTTQEMFIENGVRSGVSESATDFLDLCHQLFDDRLLRTLLFLPPRGTPASPPTLAAPSRACRHLADFLGSHDEDESPRLRILSILLAAAAAAPAAASDSGSGSDSGGGLSYRNALGQGPLWTALLRLATGRGGGGGGGGGADGGRAGRFRGIEATREGGRAGFGPMHALARDIVAAVREDRGYSAPEPRRRSGRVGSGGR